MCYSKSGYLNTDDWEDHSGFLRSKTSMTWLLQSGQASPNKIPLKVALMGHSLIQFFRRGQILPTLVSDLFTPDNLEAPSWLAPMGGVWAWRGFTPRLHTLHRGPMGAVHTWPSHQWSGWHLPTAAPAHTATTPAAPPHLSLTWIQNSSHLLLQVAHHLQTLRTLNLESKPTAESALQKTNFIWLTSLCVGPPRSISTQTIFYVFFVDPFFDQIKSAIERPRN